MDGLAQYCSQWTPKNILSAQFFSMPDRHVSSYYEPKFLGGRSQSLEACFLARGFVHPVDI